jgi:hypothetical protein
LLLNLSTCMSTSPLFAWSFSSAASVIMTHNWCMLLETPLLLLAKSLELSCYLSIVTSTSGSPRVLSNSSSFSCRFSVAAGLIDEFASLPR